MSDATAAKTRLDRLQRLQKALEDYVSSEKTRIDQEVSILQAVLNGRTGGAGIQRFSIDVADAVTQGALAYYLAE